MEPLLEALLTGLMDFRRVCARLELLFRAHLKNPARYLWQPCSLCDD